MIPEHAPRVLCREQFPVKLYAMLELAESALLGGGFSSSCCVSWLPHGRAFKIHNEQEFMEVVVPMFFKQTKIRSFFRQLNLWGYKRVSKGIDAGAWYNDHFLRGAPEELKRMVRIKIKGKKATKKLDKSLVEQKDPDFYSMPPCLSTNSNNEARSRSFAMMMMMSGGVGGGGGAGMGMMGNPNGYGAVMDGCHNGFQFNDDNCPQNTNFEQFPQPQLQSQPHSQSQPQTSFAFSRRVTLPCPVVSPVVSTGIVDFHRNANNCPPASSCQPSTGNCGGDVYPNQTVPTTVSPAYCATPAHDAETRMRLMARPLPFGTSATADNEGVEGGLEELEPLPIGNVRGNFSRRRKFSANTCFDDVNMRRRVSTEVTPSPLGVPSSSPMGPKSSPSDGFSYEASASGNQVKRDATAGLEPLPFNSVGDPPSDDFANYINNMIQIV